MSSRCSVSIVADYQLVDILLSCWSIYNMVLGGAMAVVCTEREHNCSCSG